MSDDLFRRTRAMFDLPEGVIYLDGNSLGAMKKGVPARIAKSSRRSGGTILSAAWNKHGWDRGV